MSKADEMKNRISMALKDPMLQQGFEIICRENAELKGSLELYENGCCRAEKECAIKDQLAQAKSYIKYFVGILKNLGADKEELVVKAEQFLEKVK